MREQMTTNLITTEGEKRFSVSFSQLLAMLVLVRQISSVVLLRCCVVHTIKKDERYGISMLNVVNIKQVHKFHLSFFIYFSIVFIVTFSFFSFVMLV